VTAGPTRLPPGQGDNHQSLAVALALHARVIAEAKAVHGKAGRHGVVSEWMQTQHARGISITGGTAVHCLLDAVSDLHTGGWTRRRSNPTFTLG
jgi:hypothetical protein